MTEMLELLDLGEWTPRFVVILLRTSGIVVFLPIFGSLLIPTRVKVGVAFVLALVIMPVVDPIEALPQSVLGWGLIAMREVAVGLFFGLAARTIFVGVEMAAGLIAGQSGVCTSSRSPVGSPAKSCGRSPVSHFSTLAA